MLQKGFTLIELMIVVAIIGILSMFALPAYQDYTKRTYISEGMALATGAKLAATEYFSTMGYWPADNTAAGLAAAADIKGQAVRSVEVSTTANKSEVEGGFVTIMYNDKISSTDAALVIQATGATGGSVKWICSGTNTNGAYTAVGGKSQATGIQTKWLPNNCRADLS